MKISKWLQPSMPQSARKFVLYLGITLSVSLSQGEMALANNDVLRVRIGSDVTSFDPHRPSTIENYSLWVHLYDGLFAYNYDDMSIIPRLAESFTASDDGLVYTIKLREGVQFHGGYGELTADDVKFSFDRVVDPANASPRAKEFDGVRFEVVDKYTIQATLDVPNANFLHTLSGHSQALILSKKNLEEQGTAWITRPIGTGAYQFDSWRPGDRAVLQANPDYFLGAPAIKSIEFLTIPDETAAEIALTNREIDVFFSLQAPEIIARLEARPDIKVDSHASLMTCNLVLNGTVSPFDNVLIRRAMAHAIDVESLIDRFFSGRKVRTFTPLTPEYREYTADVPQYSYDVDKARALLAEAGYNNGFEFRLATFAMAPYDQFPVLIVDDLQKVGIKANLTVMERGSYGEARASGNLPSGITCPPNSPNPDVLLRSLVHSDGFPPNVNTARYSAADDILNEARRAGDLAKRIELYHDAQRQIMSDVPVIPLFAEQLFTATHSGVEGVRTSPGFWVDSFGATVNR